MQRDALTRFGAQEGESDAISDAPTWAAHARLLETLALVARALEAIDEGDVTEERKLLARLLGDR